MYMSNELKRGFVLSFCAVLNYTVKLSDTLRHLESGCIVAGWRRMTWLYAPWRLLKEADNKRALCASFLPRYYGAQWSITCRDMAAHSGLTRGHTTWKRAAKASSKTNFLRLYLRFREWDVLISSSYCLK